MTTVDAQILLAVDMADAIDHDQSIKMLKQLSGRAGSTSDLDEQAACTGFAAWSPT